MSSVEESVDIEAPIDEVFAAVTEPMRASEWNENVLEVVNVSPGPMEAGKSWEQRTLLIGRQVTLKCRVGRYDPPHIGVLEISGPQKGRLTTVCEEGGGKTRLRQRIEFEPPGGLLGRIGGKVIQPKLHAELRHTLGGIRETLERETRRGNGSGAA